jgi:hypothetical protein
LSWDQYERRIELTNKYAGGMGVDWKGEIEGICRLSQQAAKTAARETGSSRMNSGM